MKDFKEGGAAKARAKKLFDAIAEGTHSVELNDRLRDWLFNIPENGIAEEAFIEWAAYNIRPRRGIPDRKERERFRKLVELLNIEEYGHYTVKVRRQGVSGRRIAWRVAAALVPVVLTVASVLFIINSPGRTILVADGENGRETFTLPDGSNVTLENGSELAYSNDFVTDRRVRIDGKGLFEVTRDTEHPFSVRNESLNVTVLGTEFCMDADDDVSEAEIVLMSGSIEVEIGHDRVRLQPGEQIVVDKSKRSVVEHSQATPGKLMRLSGDGLSIENLRTREALIIVADYFGMKLMVEPCLRTNTYLNFAMPANASIETVIISLNRLSDEAKCRISGDTIYVSSK